jgi:hypothetical protein
VAWQHPVVLVAIAGAVFLAVAGLCAASRADVAPGFVTLLYLAWLFFAGLSRGFSAAVRERSSRRLDIVSLTPLARSTLVEGLLLPSRQTLREWLCWSPVLIFGLALDPLLGPGRGLAIALYTGALAFCATMVGLWGGLRTPAGQVNSATPVGRVALLYGLFLLNWHWMLWDFGLGHQPAFLNVDPVCFMQQIFWDRDSSSLAAALLPGLLVHLGIGAAFLRAVVTGWDRIAWGTTAPGALEAPARVVPGPRSYRKAPWLQDPFVADAWNRFRRHLRGQPAGYLANVLWVSFLAVTFGPWLLYWPVAMFCFCIFLIWGAHVGSRAAEVANDPGRCEMLLLSPQPGEAMLRGQWLSALVPVLPLLAWFNLCADWWASQQEPHWRHDVWIGALLVPSAGLALGALLALATRYRFSLRRKPAP